MRLLLLMVVIAVLGASPAGAATVKDVPIAMSDGVRLMSDEHVPDAGCPCPVVVNFTPYTKANGGYVSTLPATDLAYLVDHGYAVVTVDVRGTGQSEGVFGIFNTREQRDYAEVIRAAAARPFADGHVAAVGYSYGGIAGILAAEQAGVDLDAVVAYVPMGDTYRDITFSGGSPNNGFLSLWGVGLVGAPSTAAPLVSATSDPQIAVNAASAHAVQNWMQLARLYTGINDAGLEPSGDPEALDGASSYDGEWFRLRSPLTHVDRVKTPVFVVGASFDIFMRAEPVLFNALPLPQSRKKLYVDNTYHGPVGSDSSSADGSVVVRDDHDEIVPNVGTVQATAWLDRWVRGKDTGVERWPNVMRRYLGAEKFVRQQADPPPGLRYERWYLRPGGALGSDRPGESTGSAQTPFNPASGACSRNTNQYTAGILPRTPCDENHAVNEADGVTFTSAPFGEARAITGPSNLHLWFSADRPDTNVVAFLSSVAPDGTSREFTFGTQVASLRRLDRTPCAPGAVVLDCTQLADGEVVQPWHPFTQASIAKLEPGRLYEADVEIYPGSIEIPNGHRLRVTLKTGSFPQISPPATVLRDAIGGITTFEFGRQHASYLTLGAVRGGIAAIKRGYDTARAHRSRVNAGRRRPGPAPLRTGRHGSARRSR